VGAKKRKTVLVLAHRRKRNFPALYGVALVATRAELPAMNIRVAIRALISHVGENQTGVAQAALHFFVQAAQRKARLVVIELREAANRIPAREGVAVFAMQAELAMWTARDAAGLSADSRRRFRWPGRRGSFSLRPHPRRENQSQAPTNTHPRSFCEHTFHPGLGKSNYWARGC